MKKKALISTCFAICFIFFSAFYNIENADDKVYKLVLDSKEINLKNPIVLQNSTIMLPVKDCLDLFDAHFDYYESNKKISSYYDNSFANLYIDKNKIFINGNELELNEPITTINSNAYAPVKFFCDFLNLEYQLNDKNIELSSRFDTNYVYLNSQANTEHKFEKYKLKLALPFGWQAIGDNYFGIENPYEKYGFKIKTTEAYPDFKPEYYFNGIIQSVGSSAKDNVKNIKESDIKTENHTFYVLHYTIEKKEEQEKIAEERKSENNAPTEAGNETNEKRTNEGKEKKTEKPAQSTHYSHYLCVEEGIIYEFIFDHSKNNSEHPVQKDFESSLRSLKVKPYDISPVYEHYLEYPRFSELEIELQSKIHSTMEIYSNFNFAGSIKNMGKGKIYSKVTREKNEKISEIEIDENGNFDALIFAPFGIGSHNIHIYEIDENNNEISLMRFNIVNLSAKDISYTIPDKYIKPNAENIKDDLQKIMEENNNKKFLNEYKLSLAIFMYVADNFVYDNELFMQKDAEKIPADKLNLSEKMTCINANIYLASIMRSADIPCRIIEGKNNLGRHIYMECKINGMWRVYDISSEIFSRHNKVDNAKKSEYTQINKNLKPIDILNTFYYVESGVYKQFFSDFNYFKY